MLPKRKAVPMKHRRVASTGYVEVYEPSHPNAHKSTGFIYEHRLVMSQILGRPLRPGEIVHHANGTKTDNRPKNLVLVSSIAEHKVEHRGRNSRLQKPGEPNPIVECACGCGMPLLLYDEIGRPRKSLNGHCMPNNRGVRNGQAKLTEDDVRSIRSERESGKSLEFLSDKYGIGISAICGVTKRRTWKHVE